jgi:hypothetical protein
MTRRRSWRMREGRFSSPLVLSAIGTKELCRASSLMSPYFEVKQPCANAAKMVSG